MIINSHAHVNTSQDYFFYNDYGLTRFLKEMQKSDIDIAFPALNPKLNIFRCPLDCSMNCQMTQKRNDNLNNCNCNHPNRHRIGIVQENGKLVIRCKTCSKKILTSKVDPLHRHNVDLINITKPYRSMIRPLIYISLCESTIQSEIDFFEEKYSNDFVGFKLHPWNDQVSVANFKIHTSKPILIHTGLRELESPKNAATFAEHNPEIKVVIAHAAALDEEILKQISRMDNVFIDCCPSVFMYQAKASSLYHPQEILSPEDIYYKVLDFLPSNKILFGTDSPWGNSEQELAVVRKLKISESIRNQILFKNAAELYLK